MSTFLLTEIEYLFLSLTVEALQGKTCQDSLLSGGGGSVWAKISGGRGRRLPACDRQTDRRTDGIAVASTTLAMRALRRAVKINQLAKYGKKKALFHRF